MRPGPRAPVSSSDIEEADVLRVLLDEGAAWLHLLAHQNAEHLVGSTRVFDVDTNQQAACGIHCRIPQLLRVHLAETLEARQLQALLREIECERAQLLERERRLGPLPILEREGRRPGHLDQSSV